MTTVIRLGTINDARECGRIYYEAFRRISSAHGFPQDQPSVEFTVSAMSGMLGRPDCHCLVAQMDGRILGAGCLHDRSPVGGVGPIVVDPDVHGTGIGRALMESLMCRARELGLTGTRLVQAAYNNHSLSLYTKLGYDVREPLANVQGPPIAQTIPGYAVRMGTNEDLDACNTLCISIYGFARPIELQDGFSRKTVGVVERQGRITAYTCGIGFRSHSVAQTDGDLKALIAAARTFEGPGFLVPMRYGELLRWCLGCRLRVVQSMLLMTNGWYKQPDGVYLPSVSF